MIEAVGRQPACLGQRQGAVLAGQQLRRAAIVDAVVAHQVGVVMHRYASPVAAAAAGSGAAVFSGEPSGLAAAFGGFVGRFFADSFGSSPWSIRNARAVSDGRAPFFSQALTFSWSMLSLTGSVIGS